MVSFVSVCGAVIRQVLAQPAARVALVAVLGATGATAAAIPVKNAVDHVFSRAPQPAAAAVTEPEDEISAPGESPPSTGGGPTVSLHLRGKAGPEGETGPVGPQGDAGVTGPNGDQGIQGETGPQGSRGEDVQGVQGDTGPQGDTGAMGPQGPQGIQGETGPEGPMGPVGPQGPQGDTGPQGIQGETGAQGPQGETGPVGPVGPMGPVGPQGPVGPMGPTGETGATGTTGSTGPQGETGPQGPQGAAGAQGVAGPSAMAIGGGSSTGVIPGNYEYLPMFEANNCGVEVECQSAMPFAGTVKNLYIRAKSAPAAGGGWRISVRKNASDQGVPPAVSCDILAGNTSCSNTTGSLTFAAGDLISIRVTTAPGLVNPVNTPMRWTAQYSAAS